MILSPLRLVRHFFTSVQIEALTEREKGAEMSLQSDLSFGMHTNDKRRFRLQLRVTFGPEGDGKPGYRGSVEALGFFHVPEPYLAEKAKELVETNGATLLFGAIRELVCNLTARGPWPMLRLQCVSFRLVSGDKPAKRIASKSRRHASRS